MKKKTLKERRKTKSKAKDGAMKNEKRKRLVKSTHLKFILTFGCRFIPKTAISSTYNIL